MLSGWTINEITDVDATDWWDDDNEDDEDDDNTDNKMQMIRSDALENHDGTGKCEKVHTRNKGGNEQE